MKSLALDAYSFGVDLVTAYAPPSPTSRQRTRGAQRRRSNPSSAVSSTGERLLVRTATAAHGRVPQDARYGSSVRSFTLPQARPLW